MLRVKLQIPGFCPADHGSAIRVALRDTSAADAMHPTVAEATARVGSGSGEIEVIIDVPEDRLDPRNRYSLWVHVDHSGTGELRPGDLITTVDFPVTRNDVSADAVLDVLLTRI